MLEHLSFLEGLTARLDGPMSLRLLMQPCMALLFAFLDGKKDARTGKPPYFWALFTDPEHRGEMLLSGWKSVGKVFIIATVLDLVFQYLVFKDFRPMAAVVFGALLALVPYLLLRGPFNRIIRRFGKGQT